MAIVFQIPLSEIDPATNRVIKQWLGPGGDSVRVGLGSVWLSNLREQTVWRLSPDNVNPNNRHVYALRCQARD